MAQWYTTRVLRKEKVFKVSLGQSFNLETITKLSHWNNPQFLVSLLSFELKYPSSINTLVTVKGVYPNYTLFIQEDYDIQGECIVFVVEGDGATTIDNNISNNNNNIWVNTAKILNNKKIVTLNRTNDFTCSLQGIEAPNKIYHILPFFKKNTFPTMLKGYNFNIVRNNQDNNFKLKIQHKTINLSDDICTYKNKISTSYSVQQFSGLLGLSTTVFFNKAVPRFQVDLLMNGNIIERITSSKDDYYVGTHFASQLIACDNNKKYTFTVNANVALNRIEWHPVTASYTTTEYVNGLNTDEFVCLIVGE